MPVKIKKRLKSLALTELAKESFAKKVLSYIVEEIKDQLKKGISPVDKGGTLRKNSSNSVRYEGYSESYSDAIDKGRHKGKRKRPVNLYLSGKMIGSLRARIIKKGVVKVWFEDAKAKYHDETGAGKSQKIRRLLPDTGEQFTRVIRQRLINSLGEAIKPFLK